MVGNIHMDDGEAKEWPACDLADKKVMVFDEFDIRAEWEGDRKIVDWDRTCFPDQSLLPLTGVRCLGHHS